MTTEQNTPEEDRAIFEIAEAKSGNVSNFHVRWLGENGETVYWTENYPRIASAYYAIGFASRLFRPEVEVVIKRVVLPKVEINVSGLTMNAEKTARAVEEAFVRGKRRRS
jgi:uncharacterized protein YegP (UPF0339 family)